MRGNVGSFYCHIGPVSWLSGKPHRLIEAEVDFNATWMGEINLSRYVPCRRCKNITRFHDGSMFKSRTSQPWKGKLRVGNMRSSKVIASYAQKEKQRMRSDTK
jgi:hypothetical protein